MSERVRVDIETVKRIQEERLRIDALDLNQIDWYENGIKIDVPQEWIDDFSFTGLNNVDFINTGVYANGYTFEDSQL